MREKERGCLWRGGSAWTWREEASSMNKEQWILTMQREKQGGGPSGFQNTKKREMGGGQMTTCLHLFQCQRCSSGKSGLRTTVACRSMMLMLLSGTIFVFCWTGLGWLCRSPGNGNFSRPPTDLILPIRGLPATTWPAQPHCWLLGSPQAQGQPCTVVQTQATLLLSTTFKKENRGLF